MLILIICPSIKTINQQIAGEVKKTGNGAKISSSLLLDTAPTTATTPRPRHQYNRALLDTIEGRYDGVYKSLNGLINNASGDDSKVIERAQSLKMYHDMHSRRVKMANRLFGPDDGT